MKTRYWPGVASALTAGIVLAIAWVFDRTEKERFRQQNRAEVLTQLSATRARLEGGLNQRLFLTRGLVAYISSKNPNISQQEFETLMRVMVANKPGIPSAALFKNTICTHLYPLKGQEEALGFDPMKIPAEREAFQRAIDTRNTVLAGPVELIGKGGAAFIARTPVFLTPPGKPPESGAYWGMVSIGIDRDTLLKEAGLLDNYAKLRYSIRGKDGRGADGKVFFGDEAIFQQDPVILAVTLPNGSWQLAAIPAAGWPTSAPLSKWLWIGASLTALLAGALMYVLVSAPTRLRVAVERATEALRKNEEALERRVAERTAELAIAKEKAEVANEAKSTFLANMSHELRSPLNAILGFAQIMTRSKNLPKEHLENISIITRSGEHLLTLINNVLDLSKIEAGRTTLNEKNFDLSGMLSDIEDMFRLKAEEKGLQLLLEHTPDVPRYIRTDEVKLRQVLINLISNAIKFTEEGGVSVRAGIGNPITNYQLPSFPGSAWERNYQLNFEVQDTGFGIAPEELEKLFEAFVQTEAGKQAQEGTGLGLSISRKFVELMGGEIEVDSTVGKGSTFKFYIQAIAISPSELESKKNPRKVIALDPKQPNYRILIADDKSINRQMLIKLLSPLGFELKEATNGIEAIEIWQAWSPHLIWMDMRMPVMDGYEATKQIKSTTQGQATAIIALTASGLEEERGVFLSAGCDDFLRKPFREADIFELMHKHIGVDYIYEDSTVEKSGKVREDEEKLLTREAMAALPTEWVNNLKQAIENVDMRAIATILDQIQTENAPLALAIRSCVDNFDYDKIVAVIPEGKL
ncbi:MAG TPA: histidine kinase [Cyanobacteria bacterium UBA11369]|nr:histidine kinase [Cyanobacteria bacterium UBA11371]HBE54376.1 histidine kinase [Cyanobacteria bacterium UBA11369]